MKNEQWGEEFLLPGSVPHIRKKTDKKTPEEKAEGSIKFGNEPNRVLCSKEEAIYNDYCDYCRNAIGCTPAEEYKWRMESQRIPTV